MVVLGTNSLPNHCYYAEENAPVGSSTSYDQYVISSVFNLQPLQMDAAYDLTANDAFYYTTITR